MLDFTPLLVTQVRPHSFILGHTGAAVLRVAWTLADLADLAGRTVPGPDEIAEALGMRLQRAAA